MTNRKNKIDARLGRRIRTRLTRVLVMAVAGPVMAGSLAYAAGVEPVRRRVDEFLKGTAGLFRTAESSTRDFHISPNPSGQGVLVMPLGDRGPRPAAAHSTEASGNEKEEPPSSGKSKEKSEADRRDAKKRAAASTVFDSGESKTKPDDSHETSSGSDASVGSSDVTEESLTQEANDSGHEGSGDFDDDRSGSNSGSDDSDDDRSGSDSGDSDSKSDED
ncbi:MAG TPA: hypothetical protein VFH75_01020 [Actinomycetota bacterium]|nr:hypothetical protein [Actinomycetota bacterium]